MKKTLLLILIVATSLLLTVSCQFGMQNFFYRAPQPDERAAVLTDLRSPLGTPPGGMGGVGGFSNSSPGKLKFLVVTDLHYGSKTKYPEEALFNTFTTEYPDFILMLGDSAEAGLKESFEEYENFLSRMRAKTQGVGYMALDFAILGNHDAYNDGFKTWKGVRSDEGENEVNSFYRFKTTITDQSGKDYTRSWYFLDSASSTLGAKQLKTVQETMKADPNPKLVFSHYPFFAEGSRFIDYFKWSNTYERALLIDLFNRNNVNMYFSGHWHPGSKYTWGNFHEMCAGSFRTDHENINHWYYITVDEENKKITLQEYQTDGGDSSTVRKLTPIDYTLGGL